MVSQVSDESVGLVVRGADPCGSAGADAGDDLVGKLRDRNVFAFADVEGEGWVEVESEAIEAVDEGAEAAEAPRTFDGVAPV